MKKINKKIKIKKIPLGINLVSAFFIIVGLLFIIQSFLFSLITFMPEKVPWIGILFSLSFNQQLVGIISLLIVGIFCIFLGLNLLKLKNWARISAISFSIASLVAFVLMTIKNSFLIINFIFIILNILILIYLAFNKSIKRYFN